MCATLRKRRRRRRRRVILVLQIHTAHCHSFSRQTRRNNRVVSFHMSHISSCYDNNRLMFNRLLQMPLFIELRCRRNAVALEKRFARLFQYHFERARIGRQKQEWRKMMVDVKLASILIQIESTTRLCVRVGYGYSRRSPAIRKTMILFLFGVVYSILPWTSAIMIVIIMIAIITGSRSFIRSLWLCAFWSSVLLPIFCLSYSLPPSTDSTASVWRIGISTMQPAKSSH